MRLDIEMVGKAGREVLALRDEVCADQTPQAFIEAQGGFLGLPIMELLAAAGNGYKAFQGRLSGKLDYLGNAVIAASRMYEPTEEQGKASFESLDRPR